MIRTKVNHAELELTASFKLKDRKAAQAAKEVEERKAHERQEQLPTLKKHHALFLAGPEASILGRESFCNWSDLVHVCHQTAWVVASLVRSVPNHARACILNLNGFLIHDHECKILATMLRRRMEIR